MKRLTTFFICIIFMQAATVKAQSLNPDSAVLALANLRKQQSEISNEPIAKGRAALVAQINRMLKLGVWDKAWQLLKPLPDVGDYALLKADYLIMNNNYFNAETLVNKVLKKDATNEKSLQLRATLQIQAWRLPQAINTCNLILKMHPRSAATQLIKGRALLLEKKYAEALAIAKKLQLQSPDNAGAYMLEADCYFWNQHPELAEAPLKKSLMLDPYSADARFSYGYAIWRRVDATQLNAMAAQWDIALAVNPLHFSTNWHWGNGHTNLTYADYAEKDDEEVRKVLARADTLFSANKVAEAIAYTHEIQKRYPVSVLPLMHRASLYYSAFDMDRKLRLDSAESIFRQILARKKHYGPAHNGLASVIKWKRMPYLRTFDSITTTLKNLKINDMKNFEAVFPDMSYYPGDMVKKMVWSQLYTTTVYFPFLAKQGHSFRVSPLHIDLAITMKSPGFRYSTTFDNRQWMDIRGVGSGCADIEYVDRGAYQERNVVLHEYTHLYHGTVFTDKEAREVRKHYYKAMAEHRTLDYYSQNNESEYLAQTFPAYWESVKVHPVDFKSMNTTHDLKTKDPEMYDWIDNLVKKQKAYLAGDKSAMADNWAQVYLNLSWRGNGAAYLDTALSYDSKYLPVFLAYSHLKSNQGDFVAAEDWLKKAQAIDAKYAPIYVAYADLVQTKFAAKQIEQAPAISQQIDYLRQSLALEDDYQERAAVSNQLRETYIKSGQIAEAIAVADDYAKNGPAVSTYLRDQRDYAQATGASLKAELGYAEPLTILQHLVEQKPQNFEFRTMYADALAANKRYDEAIKTLQQIQRILKASGNGRASYNLQIAEYYNALGKKDSVIKYLPAINVVRQRDGGTNNLRYIRLLAATGKATEALAMLKNLPSTGDSAYLSEYAYTQGKIQEHDNPELAAASYETALTNNPYFFKVYPWLMDYYNKHNQPQKGLALKSNVQSLKIPPGENLIAVQ
ncbi:Tetratricopeptide repeat-containing protein [Mucilaginibacter pineti]|uniref:Tetratricopeptide repeat-containing protein n=1 Tax=Mucilaginibacter pineti TaxID=1391627 RepID=A0A1G6U4L6_9SPHI|nr:tetratricopeptide repeat protein [Mucilaginibacter pineti]SDD35485.1 Tetratricopeptide repeat-containing protein [Mucilaginibacter pineti]